jgi:enoyl-CoA hydratase
VKTSGLLPSLEIEGAVATLWLRRPDQANRLGLDDIAQLHSHMAQLRGATEVRLVQLRGQGAQFCAGFQIDAAGEVDAPSLFDALVTAWEALPQITLAIVQGGVFGGAVDWALACDFRLGNGQGQLAIPAAQLGLHFHGGGLQRVVSRLGLAAAKQLLLAGDVWEGHQLLQRGFLDAQGDDLSALAQAWQRKLLALAPLAQRGMKRHLNAIAAGRLDDEQLQRDLALCNASSDFAEGLRAWAARRAPKFDGA